MSFDPQTECKSNCLIYGHLVIFFNHLNNISRYPYKCHHTHRSQGALKCTAETLEYFKAAIIPLPLSLWKCPHISRDVGLEPQFLSPKFSKIIYWKFQPEIYANLWHNCRVLQRYILPRILIKCPRIYYQSRILQFCILWIIRAIY